MNPQAMPVLGAAPGEHNEEVYGVLSGNGKDACLKLPELRVIWHD